MPSPESLLSRRLPRGNAQWFYRVTHSKYFDVSRGGFTRKLLKPELQKPSFVLGGRSPVNIHRICVLLFFNFTQV